MYKIVVSGMLGLMLLGVVFPARMVAAESHWIQSSVSDFNSDTMTNLEIHQPCPSDTLDAFVHLVDNQSETQSSIFNTDSYWSIDNRVLHTVSCAFHPTFNGMCDEVEFQMYVQGNPVDATGNPATITIGLWAANRNGIHEPGGILPSISHTYYLPWDFSNQPGSWIPLYVTETDSLLNHVKASQDGQGNLFYTVKVSSNAVWANVNNEIRWEYLASNSDSNQITTDQTKVGGIGWQIFGGNPNSPIDTNIKIHWHDFVHSGNLVSTVFNTGQSSTFTWFAADQRPAGGIYPTYHVRTGDVNPPDQTWSDWILQGSGEAWNDQCPNGQYVQYKVDFTATDDALQYDAFTGAVTVIDITYI